MIYELHINLNTNLKTTTTTGPDAGKLLLFEFSMIENVPPNTIVDSKYPIITDGVVYNLESLGLTSFQDILELFFNKRIFAQRVIKNQGNIKKYNYYRRLCW